MSVKTMVQLLLTWNKAGWLASCLPCNKISFKRSAANVLIAWIQLWPCQGQVVQEHADLHNRFSK